MQYVVVIPAYNEADFIGRTLDALVAQDHLPAQLLVVNDGSTDDTAAIVGAYCQKHPWIKLVNNPKKEPYASGSKVVRAFYLGFHQIDVAYDFLVKFDADLHIPPHYFQRIAQIFEADERVGLAGGTILVEKNGQWVYENFSDKDHVKGAYKAWRKACFEAIGGLKHSIGWDTADELLARYHGWKVVVDTDLPVRHYRPLGTETGSVKIRKRVGNGMYRLRYGFWITLISAFKAGYLNKPYGLTGLAVLQGWLESWWHKDEFMVSVEEGRFIRRFRRERMLGKLGKK